MDEILANIESIAVIGGEGRDGVREPIDRVDLKMGDVVSIVGPTGSGKTALINDVELLADANTPSRRRVLINGGPASEFSGAPSRHPIALITQHTNFLSDLPVHRFLRMHADIRQRSKSGSVVEETLAFANQLTGEPIIEDVGMTELSGGQTRALLLADAVVIGNSPIILLDEIENAGIHRTKALQMLHRFRKIFVFVTHDPRIALLSDRRVVMKNGAMQKVLSVESDERRAAEEIKKFDDLFLELRAIIRAGDRVGARLLESRLNAIGYRSGATS
jgi:ABC-type lipoprotein export system ATPase subunit